MTPTTLELDQVQPSGDHPGLDQVGDHPVPNTVRLVCISDTHGKHWDLQIPTGDILIHSGDFTNTGTYQEVEDFDLWLESLAHPYKLVVPGNHDSVMDPAVRKMASQGALDQVYHKEETERWKDIDETLLKNAEVLINRGINILGLNIFGCPNTMFNGQVARTTHKKYGYAFGCSHENRIDKQLDKLSCQSYDILVTHSPPLGIADISQTKNRGSQSLREAVMRLNPALHVFGHVPPICMNMTKHMQSRVK